MTKYRIKECQTPIETHFEIQFRKTLVYTLGPEVKPIKFHSIEEAQSYESCPDYSYCKNNTAYYIVVSIRLAKKQ